MSRTRARFLAWLLLPAFLLPGGMKALLCLASLGFASPCATCAEHPSVGSGTLVEAERGGGAADSCCGETTCSDALADEPSEGSATLRASDGRFGEAPCDCCVAWETAPRAALAADSGIPITFPAPHSFAVPAPRPTDVTSSRRERARHPPRAPPDAPLPLRI